MTIALAVVTSLIFAGTSLWCLFRLVTRGSALADRIQDLGHLVMSLLMIAMPWSWHPLLPPLVSLAAVAIMCATTFVSMLLHRVQRRRAAGWAVPPRLLCDVLMNTTMIWMLIHMVVGTTGSTVGTVESESHHGHQGTGGATLMETAPIMLGALLVVATVAFVIAGVKRARTASRPSRPAEHAGATTSYAVMSAGMALGVLGMTI
ncbi:DUF5134 domain-containing protein [Microbacterium sp. NPDC077663]|uniref:DUF5134 domain-containing protein n=1 Tax=Microbacterium sp. NPDC077663 TaxID=3364189 RepID=UPI0037C81757